MSEKMTIKKPSTGSSKPPVGGNRGASREDSLSSFSFACVADLDNLFASSNFYFLLRDLMLATFDLIDKAKRGLYGVEDIEASIALERRFGFDKNGLCRIADGFFDEVQARLDASVVGGKRDLAARIFKDLRGAGFAPGGELARYGRLLRLAFDPDEVEGHQPTAPLEKAAKQAHTLAMLIGCGWIAEADGPFSRYYKPRVRREHLLGYYLHGIPESSLRELEDLLRRDPAKDTIFGRDMTTTFGGTIDTWQGIAWKIYKCKYFIGGMTFAEWSRDFCDLLLLPAFTARPWHNDSNSDALLRADARLNHILPPK